jgi:hypothetical protein
MMILDDVAGHDHNVQYTMVKFFQFVRLWRRDGNSVSGRSLGLVAAASLATQAEASSLGPLQATIPHERRARLLGNLNVEIPQDFPRY